MAKPVLVEVDVRDLPGLLFALKAASFAVRNVASDAGGTYVFLDDGETKDPAPYVREWQARRSRSSTRRAVVSLGDAKFRPITDLTFPRMRRYADSMDADFHVIGARCYREANICYEKFQLRDFLRHYDRVLYLDGDVLVRLDAPDVFALVPAGRFAAMDEARHIGCWTLEGVREQFEPFGWKGPWNGRHFNAGVMVLDASHKGIFDEPSMPDRPLWDQPYFNVMVERKRIPFFSLPPEFNHLMYHVYKKPQKKAPYFLHFSSGVAMSVQEKAERMRREMRKEEEERRPTPARMEPSDREAALALFDAVEGFVVRCEGERLLQAALDALESGRSKTLVELGSYAGKMTVLLGRAAQLHGGCVFAVDPHEGEMTDPGEIPTRHPPSLAKFMDTVRRAGLEGIVRAVVKRSYEVDWSAPITLLFIDALHDYENVSRDYRHFGPHVERGGTVVFHDYSKDMFPGVVRFVDSLLASGELKRIDVARTLFVARKP